MAFAISPLARLAVVGTVIAPRHLVDAPAGCLIQQRQPERTTTCGYPAESGLSAFFTQNQVHTFIPQQKLANSSLRG